MRNVQFTPDELRDPRVEITEFNRVGTSYPGGRELFGIAWAKLNGHKLEPLLIVRDTDGEFVVHTIEIMPYKTGYLRMDDSPHWLRTCAPCVTRRMQDRITRNVLRHAREVDRSERKQA